MTIASPNPDISEDTALELLRYVDCVVMLLPCADGEAVRAASWAASLANRMRVVMVTIDPTTSRNSDPVVEGRVIRLVLPGESPSDQKGSLNQALRRLGLIRPLMWLEHPSHEAWFCESYAPFKLVALWERSVPRISAGFSECRHSSGRPDSLSA